jgi:predicted permease
MAEASGKDQETATALVVWSTLAAVLIVPLWFVLIS